MYLVVILPHMEIEFLYHLPVMLLKLSLFGHDSFQRSNRAKPFHLIVVKCCPTVE